MWTCWSLWLPRIKNSAELQRIGAWAAAAAAALAQVFCSSACLHVCCATGSSASGSSWMPLNVAVVLTDGLSKWGRHDCSAEHGGLTQCAHAVSAASPLCCSSTGNCSAKFIGQKTKHNHAHIARASPITYCRVERTPVQSDTASQ
jgi:hypothetical protein